MTTEESKQRVMIGPAAAAALASLATTSTAVAEDALERQANDALEQERARHLALETAAHDAVTMRENARDMALGRDSTRLSGSRHERRRRAALARKGR